MAPKGRQRRPLTNPFYQCTKTSYDQPLLDRYQKQRGLAKHTFLKSATYHYSPAVPTAVAPHKHLFYQE